MIKPGNALRIIVLRSSPAIWCSNCSCPAQTRARPCARSWTEGAFAGSCPVYIGDDLTDIPAIIAARKLGGRGIAVGQKIAAHADDVLAGPAEVMRHIRKLLA